MRQSYIFWAVKSSAFTLIICLAGDLCISFALSSSIHLLWYSAVSAGLLAFIPVVDWQDSAGLLVGQLPRVLAAIGLLAIVSFNTFMIWWVNGSTLGWAHGSYLLGYPLGFYVIMLGTFTFLKRVELLG